MLLRETRRDKYSPPFGTFFLPLAHDLVYLLSQFHFCQGLCGIGKIDTMGFPLIVGIRSLGKMRAGSNRTPTRIYTRDIFTQAHFIPNQSF